MRIKRTSHYLTSGVPSRDFRLSPFCFGIGDDSSGLSFPNSGNSKLAPSLFSTIDTRRCCFEVNVNGLDVDVVVFEEHSIFASSVLLNIPAGELCATGTLWVADNECVSFATGDWCWLFGDEGLLLCFSVPCRSIVKRVWSRPVMFWPSVGR